jgi:protein-disulfide isomerase
MAQNRKTAGKNAAVVKESKGSKKSFYLVLAVAAIVGVAVLSYLAAQSAKGRVITVDPNLPAVTSEGYVMGSATAPVELIEFGDFECPGCGQYAEFVEPDIRAEYVNTGKIRFRFIDYPLSGHQNTLNASNAAACGDEQGKFWEMHDAIFASQHEWNGQATTNPDKVLKAVARRIPGLDASKFDDCVDSRRMQAKVQSHLKLATDRGMTGTPTFILGNKQFGGMPVDQLRRTLDAAIAEAQATKGTTKKP